MYEKIGSVMGARRQNLSRLRVEKLGCAGSRQVDVEVGTYRSPTKAGAVGRHTFQSSVVPVSFPFFSVTVLPSSPACPWVYSPKTAFAALANLQSEDLTF